MIALLMAVLVPTALASHSGTVKVSGDQSQNDPDNEPHVPCQFSLEFFQFEADTVHVEFTAQQPSGDVHILSDTVALDPSGEEEPTFNGTTGYDFTGLLDGLERHDQQGYHIKVAVQDDTSTPPAKHKVFWIDCPEPEPAQADLLVEKVVNGDGAPDAGTQFTIEVTCDGTAVTAMLADGDDPWSWNDDSGETALTEESVCSVDETGDSGAEVTVTFNGVASDEQTAEDLGEGDNTFVVTNDFPAEGDVGGVDVEAPVELPGADVSPEVIEAAPSDEQPAAAQDVADTEVLAAELPATGATNTVLLLRALLLIGLGALALLQVDARVRVS